MIALVEDGEVIGQVDETELVGTTGAYAEVSTSSPIE